MATKFRYRIKRSPETDPQQYLVYRMENEAIGGRRYMSMSKTDIRKLMRSICSNYRVPQIRVSWAPLGKWAAEWREPHEGKSAEIVLNPRKRIARDVLTITHELAHHVHYYLSPFAHEQQDHGPEFMACHLSILDTCRIIPVVGMKAICDSYGIKYKDPGIAGSLPRLRRIVARTKKKSRH